MKRSFEQSDENDENDDHVCNSESLCDESGSSCVSNSLPVMHVNAITSEDPSIYNPHATVTAPKFQRVFKHLDGNWPGHIFINVPKSAFVLKVAALAQAHFATVGASSPSELFEEQDYHLSLSRPFVLRSHQIIAFIESLSKNLSHLSLSPFCMGISSEYLLLVNDTCSRAFLSLSAHCGNCELNGLIKCVDSSLLSFGQSKYYDDPKFHVSVASMAILDSSRVELLNTLKDRFHPLKVPYSDKSIDLTLSTGYNHQKGHLSSNMGRNVHDSISDSDCDSDDGDYRSHAVIFSDDEDIASPADLSHKSASASVATALPTTTDRDSDPSDSRLMSYRIIIDNIECKIGNRHFKYAFDAKAFTEIFKSPKC